MGYFIWAYFLIIESEKYVNEKALFGSTTCNRISVCWKCGVLLLKRGDSDLVRLGLHRCCVSYHYTFMKYENEIHVDS